MSIRGYLVYIKNKPVLVNPTTTVVEKQGQKQFWFYADQKAMLARQQKSGRWTV